MINFMTSVIVKENDVSLQWNTCKIGDCNAQVFFPRLPFSEV